MKISLNELVDMLADRTGNTFSVPIQEELKVILNYKREDWIQKVVDAHPEQRKNFLKGIVIPLEEVTQSTLDGGLDITVLKTTVPVPQPVRTQYALFDYVGAAPGDFGAPPTETGFSYTAPDQLAIMLNYGSKYTATKGKYAYINGFVYVYNQDDIVDLYVLGLWPDQRQLDVFKAADQPCYTDDDQYDVPGDVINLMMQDVIKNELRLLTSPEIGDVDIEKGK